MQSFLKYIFRFLICAKCLNRLPDKMYLKIFFDAYMEYKLNLRSPKTYNEKLQWLKLYDRKEIYSKLVDKYAVRKYIAEYVGEEYLVPLVGGPWKKVEEIDFDSLPDRFVLKTTHDSGNVIVCTDKEKLDIIKVRKELKKKLKRKYFYYGREWPYKNVKPQIFAEKYIGEDETLPDDYKFYVFDGNIDSVMICRERETGNTKYAFFDMNWERLYYQYIEPEIEVRRPENLEELINVVKKISKDFLEVRIDLYNVNGKIYFGEITLFNQSGLDKDITYETDIMWGNKIQLPIEEVN